MYTDFFIDKEEMKGYQEGEKVAVEIKKWDSPKNSPEGKIIKSLGEKKEEIEAYSILYEHGLSVEFPEIVEKEAEQISAQSHKKEVEKMGVVTVC